MILAHMEMNRANKQKQMNERGKMLMRAVGMAGKGWQANKSLLNSNCRQHSRQTLRPAQASKKQPADGRSRSNHNSCR